MNRIETTDKKTDRELSPQERLDKEVTAKEIMDYIEMILRTELNLQIGTISPTCLIRETGIDSVSLMALTVYLENKYEISCDEIFLNYENDLRFCDVIQIVFEQLAEKRIED